MKTVNLTEEEHAELLKLRAAKKLEASESVKTWKDSVLAGEVVRCTESIPLFVKNDCD